MNSENDKNNVIVNNNVNNVNIKTIGSVEPGNNTNGKKYDIIKKMISSVKKNQTQLLTLDRLRYKVDQLFIEYQKMVVTFKCGSIQGNRSQFIEALEDLPLHVLEQFYEIYEYDRSILKFI